MIPITDNELNEIFGAEVELEPYDTANDYIEFYNRGYQNGHDDGESKGFARGYAQAMREVRGIEALPETEELDAAVAKLEGRTRRGGGEARRKKLR